jgi:hypothetical protein
MAGGRVARRIRVPLGFAFAVLYFRLARPVAAIALGNRVCARAAGAGAGIGACAEERSAGDVGALCLHPQSVVPRIVVDWWVRVGTQLVGGVVLCDVLCHLSSGDSGRRVPAAEVPEFEEYARRYRGCSHLGRDRELQLGFYWKHREYNALLGAVAMIAALAIKMMFFRG